MSVAIPPIEDLTEDQRDELLGRLVLDAFVRRGFASIPVRMTEPMGALVVPRIEPAAVTTVPDMPAEYIEEIMPRAATPEKLIDGDEFLARLAQDLQKSEGE